MKRTMTAGEVRGISAILLGIYHDNASGRYLMTSYDANYALKKGAAILERLADDKIVELAWERDPDDFDPEYYRRLVMGEE